MTGQLLCCVGEVCDLDSMSCIFMQLVALITYLSAHFILCHCLSLPELGGSWWAVDHSTRHSSKQAEAKPNENSITQPVVGTAGRWDFVQIRGTGTVTQNQALLGGIGMSCICFGKKWV